MNDQDYYDQQYDYNVWLYQRSIRLEAIKNYISIAGTIISVIVAIHLLRKHG